MYEIGVSKKNITCFKKGVGMFGYGMHHHVVKGKETELYARAFVLKNVKSGKVLIFVSAEILSITTAVRKGVIKKLQRHHSELNINPDCIILTGTHTHSGPGGYSHYGFYNITIPGFVPEVYTVIVDGITDAITDAFQNTKPGKIYFSEGEFPPEIPVAFNRSVKAYNRNPEVQKITEKENNMAVNRNMFLLRFDDMYNNPIGCINWFGVHTTSVGNDYYNICSDNKGYAADFLEKEIGNGFIAAFAQEACGDVSPNYIWDKKRNKKRGKFENDYESAKFNGKLQFEKALYLLSKAPENEITEGDFDFIFSHENLTNIYASPEYTDRTSNSHTGSPCLGLSFFEGTDDGKGISPALSSLASVIISAIKAYEYLSFPFLSANEKNKILAKYKAQHPKKILMEPGERKILGTKDIDNLIIPQWADKTIFYLKTHYRSGGLDDKPWVPEVLPLQIAIIARIAIVSIPAEITYIAGQRLQKSIAKVLEKKGIEKVIICPYSNAYSGYITTHEEYEEQCYEGGHTIYGKYTLAAYQTKFKELAEEMLKPENQRKTNTNALPVEFSSEDLKKRMFPE